MPSLPPTLASARRPKPPKAWRPLPRSARRAGRGAEAGLNPPHGPRVGAHACRERARLYPSPGTNWDGPMQLSVNPALASRTYEVADFAAAQELYHSNGWTDGLPVVPPTGPA